MKTKKAKARLKKGPDIQDYVVESILAGVSEYKYFMLRKEARDHAKWMLSQGEDRVRVFKIKYVLVSDSKRKARKA